MNAKINRLLEGSGVDPGPEVRRRYGDVVGILCVCASLFSLPSAILLEPGTPTIAFVLAALGLALAWLCFVVPWERIPFGWIQAAPAAGTITVGIAAAAVDPSYGFYLVLVGGFVSYAFVAPRVIAAHVALILLALVAPIVFDPAATRKALACALIYGPGVILLCGLGAYLRRRTDSKERAYRDFAADALAIALRIRTSVGKEDGEALEDWPVAPDGPRASTRTVGIAKVVRGERSSSPGTGPWRRWRPERPRRSRRDQRAGGGGDAISSTR